MQKGTLPHGSGNQGASRTISSSAPAICLPPSHGLDNLGMVSSALDVTPATSVTSFPLVCLGESLFFIVWFCFFCQLKMKGQRSQPPSASEAD